MLQAQPAAIVAPPAPNGPYTASQMYEAAQTQRRLIRDQLNDAENERSQIAQELRQPNVVGEDYKGLEQRLKAADARLLDLREQLAAAQVHEAQSAALPGSTQPSVADASNERFEMVMVGTLVITLVLGFPLVIAFARRLWRKSAVTLTMTSELTQRLDSIERAVEATAVEIERVGEGQRFVTQLLANRAVEPEQIPRSDKQGF